MAPPLISVIVTTYNYAHTVGTAIDSALAQDYANLEVIVVDNASTDATPALMERYASDARVRYVRNAENIGMVPNHNKGLRESRGEYVSFLSADDFLLPGFISRSFDFLQARPEIDVLYTSTYFVDEHERFFGFRQMSGQPLAAYAGGRNELAGMLVEGCYMCFPTMLMPRNLYERFGELDENIKAADYEIVLRWAANGVRFAYLPEPTCAVRIHTNQQSSHQNYVADQGDIREFMYLLRKFVTAESAAQVAGFEMAIARHLAARYALARDAGHGSDAELGREILALNDHLEAIRAQNRAARTAQPRLCAIVLYDGNLALLEPTLRSLVAQTHPDWEALVIQPPGPSLAAMCRHLDPKGRIKTVELTQPAGEGFALNTALRIASGDTFCFLRSGNAYAPDHLERLHGAFAAGSEVVRSRALLVIESAAGTTLAARTRVAERPEIYPPPDDARAAAIAPAVPIDALAFTRAALDVAGPFNEQIGVFVEWELFLRLRNVGVVDSLESPVEIRMTIGAPDRHIGPATLPIYQAIVGGYPSGDPAIEAQRVQYAQGLGLALAGGAQLTGMLEGVVDLHRAIAGTRFASNAVGV